MLCLAPSSSGSRSFLLLASALAAATVALVVPASAQASSCTPYPAYSLPDASTPDVPTNTRIWYVGQWLQGLVDASGELTDCDEPPRLVDAAGVEVPTTTRSFSYAYVLVPDAPLEQGATYTIEHGCMFNRIAQPGTSSRTTAFTVTAPVDAEPPAEPDLAIGETESTEYENGFVGYHMDVEGEHEGILVMDIGESATLDPAALTGEVTLASVDTEFEIGHSCIPTWREAEPGASTTVAFASFDLAGNFSGWTEPEPVTVAEEGCQCRSGGRRTPATAALGLLLLLGLRRRPRSDRARTSRR